jgi:hypothetical protein
MTQLARGVQIEADALFTEADAQAERALQAHEGHAVLA